MRLRRGAHSSFPLSILFGHSFAFFSMCSDLDVGQRFSIKDLFVLIISIM